MRRLWIMILLLTVVSNKVSAQFSVSGKIRSLNDLTISILDLEGQELHSMSVKSSQGFNSGTLTFEKGYYQLQIDKVKYLIWVDGAPVHVKGFVDSKNIANSTVVLSGSSLVDSLAVAEREMKATKGGWSLSEIKHKYSLIILSGLIYMNSTFFMNKTDDLKFVYEGLQKGHIKANITDWLAQKVNRVDGFNVGSQFKDITLPDSQNKLISTKNYRGKLLIIDFWASWCGPCRLEMKSLKKIYEELKGDDIEFISVSVDADRAKWIKAMEEDEMPWLGLWEDKQNTKLNMMELYGFQQIPFILLVDKSGKILARNLRGEQVKNEILKHKK